MTVARTVCLGFLAVIFIGALLLAMPFSLAGGYPEGWLKAFHIGLFTSTSAVCVTGLSVVDVGKYFTIFGQIILALLAQIGGLGYMTATTVLLLLLRKRLGLRDKIAIQQSLDVAGLSGLPALIKSIIATTLVFEVAGALFMLPTFSDPNQLPPNPAMWPTFIQQGGLTPLKALWLALFHSVSAFNNAGFGLFADNLMGYVHSVPISLGISGLIIFGGIGYQVIMEAFFWLRNRTRGESRRTVFSLNFKIAISTTIALLVIGTIAFLLTELTNSQTLAPLPFWDKVLAAWFQSVTPRTAGFNTIDIGKMTATGLFITIILMFIGASPGGTGGGIKTTTFRILVSCTTTVLKGKEEVLCFQRQIPIALILKAVAVALGSALTVTLSTTLLTLTDPKQPFMHLFFEAMSAFGTVGLSAVGTANLTILGQLILVPTMYIGRVGVLLLMSAILGDPKPSFVKYPEENLLVG
ncbi:MAG: ATPase [Alkalinema sp. CACIAM 70d]|nr:MAG: ATPase [Alkalinema sp. CACIAM 70d]